MKRLIAVLALAAVVVATPAFSQSARVRPLNFASDFQTVPVMGNTRGVGGATFQTLVALLNPTSSAFPVEVTLYDAAGGTHEATINLAAGELKTYPNFLEAVFGFSGGGAVTFRSPDTAGGTHNNRFIVNAEVWTAGNRYGTSIPAVEFPGSTSRSFAAGITVDANTRTNIGCFNQAGVANTVKATVYDKTGQLAVGTVNLSLPANAWGQTGVPSIVSDGYVQFEPSEAAVCYAVVVSNGTNDGRFIQATEYQP